MALLDDDLPEPRVLPTLALVDEDGEPGQDLLLEREQRRGRAGVLERAEPDRVRAVGELDVSAQDLLGARAVVDLDALHGPRGRPVELDPAAGARRGRPLAHVALAVHAVHDLLAPAARVARAAANIVG